MGQIYVPTILQILIDFFEGCFLWKFYGEFLERRFQEKQKWEFGIMVLYVLFQNGKKLLLPTDYGAFQALANLFLSFLFLYFLGKCFYKHNPVILVFVAVSFLAIHEVSRIIRLVIPYAANIVILLFGWCREKGWRISEKSAEAFVKIVLDLMWLLGYGIRIGFMWLSLNSISKNFYEREFVEAQEIRFLLIPSLTSLCVTALLNTIMFRTVEGLSEFLFDLYPFLRFFILVILFLMVLSILYGVKLFQDMISLNKERKCRSVLEKQMEIMMEYSEEEKRIQSEVCSIKHDLRNTLAVISQIAGREETHGAVSDYLLGLKEAVNRLEYQFETGNFVVDALLNLKYKDAIERIPDLTVDAEEFFFPQDLKISSYDIGIIVGNALDNGIEACERLKEQDPQEKAYIKLITYQKRQMFFMEIENSFCGELLTKKTSEFPVTDKKDKSVHGIGLANIKRAVKLYHGAVEWEVKGRVFLLAVMLQNQSI